MTPERDQSGTRNFCYIRVLRAPDFVMKELVSYVNILFEYGKFCLNFIRQFVSCDWEHNVIVIRIFLSKFLETWPEEDYVILQKYQIVDEFHFMLKCEKYSDLRTSLFSAIDFIDTSHLNDEELFTFIMSYKQVLDYLLSN
jgi:hypothetical protein